LLSCLRLCQWSHVSWRPVFCTVEEEDVCRPDVVECVRGTVTEVWDDANSDDCLSGGGAKDIAAEPDEVTDARKDGWAVTPSSTPSFLPTTVVLILSSLSNPSPTLLSLPQGQSPKFNDVSSPSSIFTSPSSKLRSDASNLSVISLLRCFSRKTAGGQRGFPIGILLLCNFLNFLLRLSTVQFRLGYLKNGSLQLFLMQSMKLGELPQ
jgi:hypothetical protein